ncbi:MAG TPA: hypothetical protein VM510_04950 [Caulifigura sp.]|nr:hypothetical protein [Caulifigura sp.]
MRTVEELLAAAAELSEADRRRLIVLLQDSLEPAADPEPPQGFTRDLWEDTPEYHVGAAQAISVEEIKRRLAQQGWLRGLFQ